MKQTITKQQWEEISTSQKLKFFDIIKSKTPTIGELIEFLGDRGKGQFVSIGLNGKRPCFRYTIKIQLCEIDEDPEWLDPYSRCDGIHFGLLKKNGNAFYYGEEKGIEDTIWGEDSELIDALWEATKYKLNEPKS